MLTGSPGVGKTSIAISLAKDLKIYNEDAMENDFHEYVGIKGYKTPKNSGRLYLMYNDNIIIYKDALNSWKSLSISFSLYILRSFAKDI